MVRMEPGQGAFLPKMGTPRKARERTRQFSARATFLETESGGEFPANSGNCCIFPASLHARENP